MITESKVRSLLEPFGIELTQQQISQLQTYLELLLRWNKKINLTSIRGAEECVTRHFGESLYLARFFQLEASLLDIGSGAGFPGLTLKIAFPNLALTLLEPVAKKRAFLKETARVCGMDTVEARSERLEDFVSVPSRSSFRNVTSRAVGRVGELAGLAAQCLAPEGRIFLWVGRRDRESLATSTGPIAWTEHLALPLSNEREILVGKRGSQ